MAGRLLAGTLQKRQSIVIVAELHALKAREPQQGGMIGAGADVSLLNNAGLSALGIAEARVEADGEEREDESEEAPTEAQKAEHEQLVALLKAHGAT